MQPETPTRTPFAYCPRPTRRGNLAYRFSRDLFAGPIYGLAAFAAAGVAVMLVVGILQIAGIRL